MSKMLEGFKVIDLQTQMGFSAYQFPAISVSKRVMTINSQARSKIGTGAAIQIGINSNKELAIIGVPIGTRGSTVCNTSMKTKGVLARGKLCEMILKIAGEEKSAQFQGKIRDGVLVFDLKKKIKEEI